MIVYHAAKKQFLDDVLTNDIENIIYKAFLAHLGRHVPKNEINSWKNSLRYMDAVLQDAEIPDDCRVAIEYQIPQTCKRLDFMLSGQGASQIDYAILIELKQWSKAELTTKDSIVRTQIGRGMQETTHPSYQVWSYAALLEGFNQAVYDDKIELRPCAYLHNYEMDEVITNSFYAEYLEKAPVFLKRDAVKLREFIKKFVKYGDHNDILQRIEFGKIKPSKQLADSLSSMLKGNEEFVMIDDQKMVYETAMALARKSGEENKKVLIVNGGPGTGKSVVAINLLVNIIKEGLNTLYVTKNAAPRTVYESKLKHSFKKSEISNFFTGSGVFTNATLNIFDVLVVDEAHRLNEKSGLYKNLGDNQIKEIIHASKFTVFFLDEDQKVTLFDIGDKEEIKKWALASGAEVYETDLNSQFRCNGSNEYLAWLDNTLQIRATANPFMDLSEFDFQIFDTSSALRDAIFIKNRINNKARLTAGYCWDWISRKDSSAYDIIFPDDDFEMKWNLKTDGNLWITNPESVAEVGCIHTCQGLEVDYIGVIIGDDLIVRDGLVITRPSKRSRHDKSIFGYRKLERENPKNAADLLDRIIKNTYRTLMTRGMKGCYIFCTDKETSAYFKERFNYP